MGEGEIEVVTAEEKVVAHGDAVKAGQWGVGFLLGGEEAEVGRAAADIDHKDVGFCSGCGKVGLFQPGVEGRLGLLEQDGGFGKTRSARGFEGELLGGGVERSRDGDREVLLGNRGVWVKGVPRGGKCVEECREGFNGAELFGWGNLARTEREELRAAVGGVMDEPGFRRVDDATGNFRCPSAGEAPNFPIATGGREVEKRRERFVRGAGVIRLCLRNF